MGPYLFGLIYFASRIHPEKTLLVPCLHDEPFAYLGVMKKMFEAVRGFMFNTEPEHELARRLFGICRPRSVRVVGMGIDPFEADPNAFAARHGLTPPYVIYSGRREDGKGTPLLCDYMQAFRERTGQDIKLVFTGSGPIEAPPELLPHILDLGFVGEQEKHEAMAGALAFVHPSTFESLGIVLLESLLAGTPALVHARSEVLQLAVPPQRRRPLVPPLPRVRGGTSAAPEQRGAPEADGRRRARICFEGIFLGVGREAAFRFAGCRLMKNAGGTSAEDSGHYTGGRDDLQCLELPSPADV